MTDAEMFKLLGRGASETPSLARIKAQTTIETNPLAMWANEKLIYDIDADTRVGVATKDKFTGQYENRDTMLYPNYCAYMDASGHRSLSLTRFPGTLDDLCRAQLRLSGVYRHRNKDGSHFRGIRLRVSTDINAMPFVYDAITTGRIEMKGGDGTMMTQAIESVDDVDYVRYTQTCNSDHGVDKRIDDTHAHIGAILPEKSTYPTPSAISTGYGESPPTIPVTPYTQSLDFKPAADPELPIGGNHTTCAQCGRVAADRSALTGFCQRCAVVNGQGTTVANDDIGLMLGNPQYAKPAQKRPER
jgi:hypothetical protein